MARVSTFFQKQKKNPKMGSGDMAKTLRLKLAPILVLNYEERKVISPETDVPGKIQSRQG